MAHSERKRPLFGKEYVQHYDDSGNKIGKSFDKKNILTNNVKTVHTDQNNNKIGSSENIKDSLTGKTYTQHYDQDGNPTSYTERKKNIWGKYKSYTKSGKKRTTQEYLAIIILVGIAIYFIFKVILPIAFILTTPVITTIALVNLIKSKDEKYFKYSLVCSSLFILDYLFKGYSSYLLADGSFISKNIYLSVGLAFVCFGLSVVILFYNKLNNFLIQHNIKSDKARKSILVLIFLILITPFYFVENKCLKKPDTLGDQNEGKLIVKPNINDKIQELAKISEFETKASDPVSDPASSFQNDKFSKSPFTISDGRYIGHGEYIPCDNKSEINFTITYEFFGGNKAIYNINFNEVGFWGNPVCGNENDHFSICIRNPDHNVPTEKQDVGRMFLEFIKNGKYIYIDAIYNSELNGDFKEYIDALKNRKLKLNKFESE